MIPWKVIAIIVLIGTTGILVIISPISFQSEINLEEGEETMVIRSGKIITISFDKMISDNRCPIDVVCITSGQVILQITLTSADLSLTANMTGYGVGPYDGLSAQLDFDNLTLHLIDVLPHPSSENNTELSEAIFTLESST